MSPFAFALFTICQEENSTTSVELIRNAALAKLASGEATTLVNSSLNGKSFSVNVSKSAADIFTDATAAIKAFNGGTLKTSQIDFSGI